MRMFAKDARLAHVVQRLRVSLWTVGRLGVSRPDVSVLRPRSGYMPVELGPKSLLLSVWMHSTRKGNRARALSTKAMAGC